MLRSAETGDLPRLRAMAREALVHDADAEDVLALLWHAAPSELRIVAEQDHRIIGFTLGSLRSANGSTPLTGHLDLIVVDRDHRLRGHGRALLAQTEARLAAAGAARLHIRGNTPDHAWPGLDIRYTEAVCLLEASGYDRMPDGHNMTVDLRAADLDTHAEEGRLSGLGVTVRRIQSDDEPGFAP